MPEQSIRDTQRMRTKKPLASPQVFEPLCSTSVSAQWPVSVSGQQCSEAIVAYPGKASVNFLSMWENRVRFTEHTILKQIATITLQQD